MDQQTFIANELAIRIANLEIEKARLAFDLNQARTEIAELKNMEEEGAE